MGLDGLSKGRTDRITGLRSPSMASGPLWSHGTLPNGCLPRPASHFDEAEDAVMWLREQSPSRFVDLYDEPDGGGC